MTDLIDPFDAPAPVGVVDPFASVPAATPKKPSPTGFFSAAARGFKRSLPETQSLLYGAGAALAGAVGADELRDRALANYQRIEREQVQPLQNQATFKGVVAGDDSAGEWAGDVLGNFGGQAVQSLATAAAGAAIGSAAPGAGTAAGAVGGLVARGAAKRLITESVESLVADQLRKGVTREVAEAAGKAALQQRLQQVGGATLAGLALNTGQEAGIAYTGRAEDAAAAGEALDAGDAWRALGAGAVAGAVDSAAESIGVGRLLQGASSSPRIARRLLAGATQGAVTEGATEGVQAAIERWGAQRDLTGAEATDDYIENIAAGALGGGAMGAAGGVRRALPEGQPPNAPPLALPSPVITVDPAGEAITPAQAFQQQQADVDFMRRRQAVDLAGNVNPARPLNPAAVPNVDALTDNGPMGRLLPLSADKAKLRVQALAPGAPPTLALPPPEITINEAGQAVTAAQLFQQQQADADFVRRRENMDLTADVNQARAAHPGAAPNEGASVGVDPARPMRRLSIQKGPREGYLHPAAFAPVAGLPDPANGPLSRAVNVAAETGALASASASDPSTLGSIPPTRGLESRGAAKPARPNASGSGATVLPNRGVEARARLSGDGTTAPAPDLLNPETVSRVREYLTAQADRGPLPNTNQLVAAFGLTKRAMGDLRNEALVARRKRVDAEDAALRAARAESPRPARNTPPAETVDAPATRPEALAIQAPTESTQNNAASVEPVVAESDSTPAQPTLDDSAPSAAGSEAVQEPTATPAAPSVTPLPQAEDAPALPQSASTAPAALPSDDQNSAAPASAAVAASPDTQVAAVPARASGNPPSAGKTSSEFVRVRDVYGDSYRVRAADLGGTRALLPTFNVDGLRRKGRSVQRENLDPDGSRTREAWKDVREITRRGATSSENEGFRSRRAALAAIEQYGQSAADFELVPRGGGLVAVRKRGDAAQDAPERPVETAPQPVDDAVPEITPAAPAMGTAPVYDSPPTNKEQDDGELPESGHQSDRSGELRGAEHERPADSGRVEPAGNLVRGQSEAVPRVGGKRRTRASVEKNAPRRAGRSVRGAADEPAPDAERVPASGRTADDPVTPSADFALTDELEFQGVGEVKKFNQNLNAIRVLKAVEARGTPATPEEQSALARYVGWGGLPQAFRHPTTGAVKKGWEQRVADLTAALSAEELAAAGRSTQDAHYTARNVVDAMWSAVQRLGFTHGRVLEPSLGTGNFFGRMPAALRSTTQRTGVELDSITGRIARALYPTANVQVRGFHELRIVPESFDLVIGNPPFGAQSVHDPQYPDLSRFSIHNYFFAKSIAALRPGGLLAMVVSNSFLDANTSTTREWIAERARFLGAIRLPQTAFAKNAGTNVTTDIVFLQRLGDGEASNAEDWVPLGSTADQKAAQIFPLNISYVDHPQRMLGRMVWSTHTTHGAPGAVLEARHGVDLTRALEVAVSRLPEAVYRPPGISIEQMERDARDAEQTANSASAPPDNVKVYGYYVDADGALRQRQPDHNGERTNVEAGLKPTETQRVAGMVNIRDTMRRLLSAELRESSTDAELDELRAELGRTYDAFTKASGLLSRDVNKRAFRSDPDAPLLLSLERDYDRGVSREAAKKTGGAPRAESARKADLFHKRVQYPVKPVTQVNDAKSAMLASLNERGRIDMDFMRGLYAGKSADEVMRELGDLAYALPDGTFESSDAYLSGNVKAKLSAARVAAEAEPAFRRNVDALEAVQPADVDPADIFVQLGTPWIPVSDYNAFAKETFEGSVTGNHVAALGQWLVKVESRNQVLKNDRWGTDRMGADKLMAALMMNKPVSVYDPSGSRDLPPILNKEATAAAQGKAAELAQAFGDWIWKDADRRERLARYYNDTFNTTVERGFNGAHMSFPGMARGILANGELRPHQSGFAYRMIQDGVALAEHVVGAGKTYASIAGIMEMRRLGLWRKPMVVVPNHLVDQWSADFLRLYPGANILAASRQDFEGGKRRQLFARIATGEWDAVVVAHSSFGFIPLPADAEASILESEAQEIGEALDAVRDSEGKNSLSFKQLQKRKDRISERLDRISERGRDDLLDFAEMGVDALVVDEAHEFKNLYFVTTQRNVAGLGNPEGSKKAFDLFVKMRYLEGVQLGKNRVFLTGTPVSNTLSEVFHFQRYLQYGELKQLGVTQFDGWASTFGAMVTDWEMDAAGRFKEKKRFSKFANLPELRALWRQFADTVTRADLIRDAQAQGHRFPLPKIKTGGPQNIVVARSPLQAAYIGIPEPQLDGNGQRMLDPETGAPKERYPRDSIIGRMENMPKDPSIDNHLKATGDARKAGLDYRLVDPSAPDFAESKVNVAADHIARVWQANKGRRGTQLVFCDLSVPASARGRATEAAQAKAPTWFIRNDRQQLQHVDAVKVGLSAWPDRVFFLHKARGTQVIVDAGSGAEVARDVKRQDVIDLANAKLAREREAWQRTFDSQAIPIEDMEAYLARWEAEQESKDGEATDAGDTQSDGPQAVVSLDELLADQSRFSVYDDLRAKLIARGIPEGQIAFIHDYATDQRKADLFAKVNRGDIRVLLGSTAKMGAGMNVQRKLVALHHLDAPWRPSDLEQREGRIVRQGNEFYEADPDGFEIEILRYATKQTYDARQWEILERKARGIESFRAGDASVREIEDVTSEAANAAEMKGSASGNPLILESVRLRSEVRNLEAQERSHKRSIHQLEALVRKFNARDHFRYKERDRARRAVAQLDREGPFSLTLGERTFDERKAVKAEPVLAAFKRATTADGPVHAGSFRGADIWVGHRGDTFRVSLQVGDFTVGMTEFGREGITPGGYVSRLENMVERSDRLVAEAEALVQQFEREAKQASEEMTRGFPQQADLDAKRDRFQKVVAALRAGKQAVDGDPPTTGAFSRPNRPGGRGTAATAVRRAIAPIIARWSDNAPRVVVVETGDDLPASAQSQVGYAQAEGFYDGQGTVYLVAANLADGERAKAVLAHEAIGHYGVEAITGSELWGQLESTVDRMRASGRYADLFAEIDRRYRGANRAIATREAIAVMAEKGIRNSVIDRVIAAVRRFLRALGFDAAFSAAELRQLIVQAARYVRDGARPRIAPAAEATAWSWPARPFYSAFTEAVRNAKGAPKVATAGQWQQWLDGAQRRGEFRQGERDWSGVDAWLAGRDKTTRQELEDYVDFNELVLRETVLFDLSKPLGPSEWEKVKVPAALQADADELAKHGFEVVRLKDDPRRSKRLQQEDNPGVLVPADDFYWLVDEAAYHAANNIEMHHGGDRKLKELFKQYSSRDGERYRELLLTLPTTERRLTSEQQQRMRSLRQRPYNTLSNVERIELDDAVEHEYFSGHFPQDSNILAHVRFNERVDSEGRAVLFIEEIQSDWHQQGRREGYRRRGPDTAEEAEYRALVQRLRASEVLTPDEQQRRKELHKRVQPGWDGVPDAPMKNAADWSLLAFKRMVRWAVDHGIDRIAWTSGAQQAARYTGTDGNQARREQGLGAFYDQLLPTTINQWAKRFNGRTGRHSLGLKGEAQEGSHVLDLTPAMQEAARAGLPMFSRPDPKRAAARLVLSAEGRQSVKDWLTKRGAAKLTDLKPALLGAIPMNALADFAPPEIPGIGHYLDLRYQLDAYRHQRYVKTDAIAKKWLSFTTGGGLGALLRREPTAHVRALADLMHDSTVAGVDPTLAPSTYKKDPEKVLAHRALRQRFDALPTTGRELYVSVRDAYTEQMKLIEKALEDNLERAIQINRNRADREYEQRLEDIDEDAELDDAGRAEQKAKAARSHASQIRKANQRANAQVIALRAKFEAQRVDAPYFPLKRFGRYFAVVKRDGRMVGFSKFEGRAELDAFAAKTREQGLEVRTGVDAEKTSLRQSIDPRFVADIQQILDNAGAPDFLRDEVYQLYLERLPDLSLRKSFIHRKKVPGYNADALRAFGSAMFHGSYQLARLKYALEMGEALDVAEQQAKAHAPIDGILLVNELRKRHEFILNPQGSAVAQAATSAAFVYHLGANPAHLFLNATQTLMLGVPILGSRYGFGKASRALTQAAQDFARGKGHIEKAALTPAELKAAQAFMDMGVWEKTQAHDLAGVGDKGIEYSAVRESVMAKLGWIFHQSERFNREVTSMTAYRLAREAGDTHDAAVQRAAKLTYEVHFDYSAANRPRWMQSDVAKVLFVFRNYNVNLIYRLFRDVHQAFRAESAQARAEARRQLGAMMGMYALMAGVTGVPLYGVAIMLAGLFEDEDDPLTAEQQFARGTRELLGEDAARVLLSGVPGSLLGVDVSERIGLPNLWFRSPDRELEGRDAYLFWMEQVLGAAMAVPKNVFTGLQQMHDGHIQRGVETMLPAFARSPLRAMRYFGEGATTLDGQVITDVGLGGVAAQALGLTPLVVAEQYERNSELKGADARLVRRRQQLMNRYFMAIKQRDRDASNAAMQEIRSFNRSNPAYSITRDTLNRSHQTRTRHVALSEHGITVTRRMRALSSGGTNNEGSSEALAK